jgi:uncharacterized protein YmfQ (DUF2313 family)
MDGRLRSARRFHACHAPALVARAAQWRFSVRIRRNTTARRMAGDLQVISRFSSWFPQQKSNPEGQNFLRRRGH